MSRVADVNSAMPTIIFEAKDAAGNDMVAVKVTMDGQPLATRLEGAPLSIDPGEHTFRFETDGQPGVQKTFVIRESEKDRRELIVLGAVAASTPPLDATLAGGDAAPGGGMSTKRLTGIIVGGAGLLGLGVGTTLLVLASSLSHRSASEDAASPGSGHSDHEAALGDQTAGFVVGGIGIAALGVGAYLVLTGGSSSSRSTTATTALHVLPTFGPHQAGLGLGGAF
jgi:serine/threonine-protein kinase